jgi:Domain of unknown function (DUF4372)/Transposase DDE domain
MYTGKLVFAQLMGHLPLHTFRRCVARYGGDRKVRRFTCLDQYLCMAFAQFTYRESLRDVEACLRAQRSKLYHMGISSAVSRSTLAELYRCRWQVELFFKWIKQHLRIKAFYGTSENAVRSQIWIAVSIYVLIAIVKKRLAIKASLYTMLQVLSPTPFEKMSIDKAFFDDEYSDPQPSRFNQLNLFD